MKTLLFVLTVLCLVAGCSPDQAFVKGVEGYTDVILPEYEKYVDNDSRLNANDKKIRKDSAKGLRALIKEAKDDE